MKILIVGAGIAGLTLALCLERHGHEPIVVEKSSALRDGGYMIDFFGPGFDAAEKLGLRPELEAMHFDLQRMTYLYPSGKPKFSVPLAALRALYDNRILNFLRGDLERLLYSKAEDRVEIRFGSAFDRFEQDSQTVRAWFADGQSETFDLLVGCDGVHSRVRGLAFGREENFARFVGYYAAAFILDRPLETAVPTDAFYTLGLPGRQVSVYPIRDNRVATLFLHKADRHLADFSSEAIRSELRTVYSGIGWIIPELLDRWDEAREVYFDQTEQIELPRWSDGRVVLAGDSCQSVSLLAGQGASMALAGAYVLADELAAGKGDLPSTLARYEAKLKPTILAKQKGGRDFARWFVPDSDFRMALRDLGMRAAGWRLAAPLLKRQFGMGQAFKF